MAKKKRPKKSARPLQDGPRLSTSSAPADVALPLDDLSAANVVSETPDVDAPPSTSAPIETRREPSPAEMRHPPKIAVSHDGTRILVSRMRPETLDELRTLYNNTPELHGAGALPGAPAVEDIPDELVTGIYDGLSAFSAWLLHRSGKFSPEQLQIMFLTSDEHAAVLPVTKKLLQKYLPAGAGKYADECALAFILYGIFSQKQQQLAATMKRPGTVTDFPRGAAAVEQA